MVRVLLNYEFNLNEDISDEVTHVIPKYSSPFSFVNDKLVKFNFETNKWDRIEYKYGQPPPPGLWGH